MTIEYLASYVQSPTVAPTVSSGSGSFIFAHRRVNLGGYVSEPSPNTVASAFPVTLTPQTYSETTQLLRDEFIVSNDGGITWRIIPRTGTLTGAQTVTAYDGTWSLTDRLDTQSQTPATLDLGEYDAGGSDTQTIFARNLGDSVGLLTASILNTATQQVYTEISGQVELSLLGTLVASGTGTYTTTYNRTITWNTTSESGNTFPILLPQGSVAKISVRLINYPTGGLTASSINFSLELTANQRTNTIVFDRGWLNRTLLYSVQDGFTFPIVSYGGSSGVVTVSPFAFNFDGVSVVNPRNQNFTAPVPSSKLIVYKTGELAVISQLTSTPSNAIEIVSFSVTTSITNVSYKVNFRPVSLRKRTVTSGVLGDFVRINSSGNLVVSTASEVPHGVLIDSTGNYGVTGVFVVNAGGTITAGSRVTSNATGKAVTTTNESPYIAITGGSSGSQILVETINTVALTTSITTAQITDFAEGVDDRVNALLVDSTSVVKTYNDAGNTLSLSVPTEYVQDTVDGFLLVDGTTFLTKTYNDAGNTLTLGVNTTTFREFVLDSLNGRIASPNGSINVSHDDPGDLINVDINPAYLQLNKPGMVTMFAGSTAPTGWLFCEGQAVSRTTYASLFTAIGTTWGSGDGSTTFNLPDMRNAVPAGVGSDGSLGSSAGSTSKSVPLASHTHTITVGDDTHVHSVSIDIVANSRGAAAGNVLTNLQASGLGLNRNTTGYTHNHTATASTEGTVSPTIDVRQTTRYINYIIYTGVA